MPAKQRWTTWHTASPLEQQGDEHDEVGALTSQDHANSRQLLGGPTDGHASSQAAMTSGHGSTKARRLLAPTKPKPHAKKPYPAECLLPEATIDASNNTKAACFKRAAEFKKKVKSCKGSATCTSKVCAGAESSQEKASKLVEAGFPKIFKALNALTPFCKNLAYPRYGTLFSYIGDCLREFPEACPVLATHKSPHPRPHARPHLSPTKPHAPPHRSPTKPKPHGPPPYPTKCHLPKAVVDAAHDTKATCFRSAADYKAEVDQCRASSTCDVTTLCSSFAARQAKAQKPIEADSDKIFKALDKLPKSCKDIAFPHYSKLFEYLGDCLVGFSTACDGIYY